MTKSNSLHAEASLHRKLVLFAVQLEGYLAHFPNCHKLNFMEEKHNEMYRQLPGAFIAAHRG